MKNELKAESAPEDRSTIDVLEYLEKMAENKLDSERKREESIIQQASNMQTAFSFSTAALFMVATIIYDYRGEFSYYYFFTVFVSITACLLTSLIFATMAQNRMETLVFPEIEVFYAHVEEYYQLFKTEEQRIKYYIERCAEAQHSLTENNKKRVKWLRRSMRTFYISIAMCVLWTAISAIITLTIGGI